MAPSQLGPAGTEHRDVHLGAPVRDRLDRQPDRLRRPGLEAHLLQPVHAQEELLGPGLEPGGDRDAQLVGERDRDGAVVGREVDAAGDRDRHSAVDGGELVRDGAGDRGAVLVREPPGGRASDVEQRVQPVQAGAVREGARQRGRVLGQGRHLAQHGPPRDRHRGAVSQHPDVQEVVRVHRARGRLVEQCGHVGEVHPGLRVQRHDPPVECRGTRGVERPGVLAGDAREQVDRLCLLPGDDGGVGKRQLIGQDTRVHPVDERAGEADPSQLTHEERAEHGVARHRLDGPCTGVDIDPGGCRRGGEGDARPFVRQRGLEDDAVGVEPAERDESVERESGPGRPEHGPGGGDRCRSEVAGSPGEGVGEQSLAVVVERESGDVRVGPGQREHGALPVRRCVRTRAGQHPRQGRIEGHVGPGAEQGRGTLHGGGRCQLLRLRCALDGEGSGRIDALAPLLGVGHGRDEHGHVERGRLELVRVEEAGRARAAGGAVPAGERHLETSGAPVVEPDREVEVRHGDLEHERLGRPGRDRGRNRRLPLGPRPRRRLRVEPAEQGAPVAWHLLLDAERHERVDDVGVAGVLHREVQAQRVVGQHDGR